MRCHILGSPVGEDAVKLGGEPKAADFDRVLSFIGDGEPEA